MTNRNMTESFADYLASLNTLDWSELSSTYTSVDKLLRHLDSQRHLLIKYLEMTDHKELIRRIDLSHELTTHYKWFIHKDISARYSVWIHEYKNKALRRLGYAGVLHDHRYWFSSLVLCGGFTHTFYSLNKSLDASSFDERWVGDEKRFIRGNVYTMNPDMIHSIEEIEDPTITLVIRSKAIKPYSNEYDLNSKSIVHHYPLPTRAAGGYPFLSLL